MDSADSRRSLISGSGRDRVIPLFIFEASRAQFEIPTTATCGGSRRLCNTFKGLFGEISASPISSIVTRTIVFSFFS
jgi:hypothetical protein